MRPPPSVPGAERARIFYGGWAVLALSVAVFLSTGIRFTVGPFLFLVHQTGAAIGSWLGGFLFELSGGYGLAFSTACIQLLAGPVLSLTIDERQHRLAPAWNPVAGGC